MRMISSKQSEIDLENNKKYTMEMALKIIGSNCLFFIWLYIKMDNQTQDNPPINDAETHIAITNTTSLLGSRNTEENAITPEESKTSNLTSEISNTDAVININGKPQLQKTADVLAEPIYETTTLNKSHAPRITKTLNKILNHNSSFTKMVGVDPTKEEQYDYTQVVKKPFSDSELGKLIKGVTDMQDGVADDSLEKNLEDLRKDLKKIIESNKEYEKEIAERLKELRPYPPNTDIRLNAGEAMGGSDTPPIVPKPLTGLTDVQTVRKDLERKQRNLKFMTTVAKDILSRFQSISTIKSLLEKVDTKDTKKADRIASLKTQQDFFKDPANVEAYYNRIIYLVILVSGWIFFFAAGFSYVWKANKDLEFKRTIHMFNTRKFPSLLNNVREHLDNIYTLKNYLVNPVDVDKRKVNVILAYNKLVPRGPSRYEYTPDTSIVYNETEAIQHVINQIKRQLYMTHISTVQTYEQNNFFKVEATALPFPWAEVFLNLLLIAVCVGVIAAVFMKYNPYDLAQDIKIVRACDKGEDDALQGQRCEIIEERQALDKGFQKTVIGVAIFIVTLYVALNIIASTLSYEQALYYISSRSILA
jgi:hypothetical protein